ncbi:Hypothetical predicted protein [Xyrichtys novacula]|uniref:Uncharacterized protein n=1 Tax=Xyrichtys novacula TaxID=13765 RepID=A0AAV1FVM0_XYRNO|nr:Hypothetical predicted protein [Xyrichtys novacula]
MVTSAVGLHSLEIDLVCSDQEKHLIVENHETRAEPAVFSSPFRINEIREGEAEGRRPGTCFRCFSCRCFPSRTGHYFNSSRLKVTT